MQAIIDRLECIPSKDLALVIMQLAVPLALHDKAEVRGMASHLLRCVLEHLESRHLEQSDTLGMVAEFPRSSLPTLLKPKASLERAMLFSGSGPKYAEGEEDEEDEKSKKKSPMADSPIRSAHVHSVKTNESYYLDSNGPKKLHAQESGDEEFGHQNGFSADKSGGARGGSELEGNDASENDQEDWGDWGEKRQDEDDGQDQQAPFSKPSTSNHKSFEPEIQQRQGYQEQKAQQQSAEKKKISKKNVFEEDDDSELRDNSSDIFSELGMEPDFAGKPPVIISKLANPSSTSSLDNHHPPQKLPQQQVQQQQQQPQQQQQQESLSPKYSATSKKISSILASADISLEETVAGWGDEEGGGDGRDDSNE